MERAQSMTTALLNTKSLVFSALFVLFHLVGLIGLLNPSTRQLFLKVVPWHLLLMFILVIINHDQLNSKFFIYVALTCLCGFMAEWIGVHTNILFGKYYYGKSLGVKIWSIPLTMCFNWFMLIYTVGITLKILKIQSVFVRMLAGAVTLVLLDILIEPVAVQFDYWHWQNNLVPLLNYICWFSFSVIMLYMFELFNFKKQNYACVILLIAQFLFFTVLNLKMIF